MAVTRFMQVMFSAGENNDEELTSQVANDIENTKAAEVGDGVEDDEVSYVNLGSGKVLVIDKENGESTIAEQSEEDPEQYDLEGFENDQELEKYLHMQEDGVTPDENVKTEVIENAEDHMTGEDVISPNLKDGGLNPEAGYEPTIEERYEEEDDEDEDVCPECGKKECECEDDEDEDEDGEEREYSVTMTEEELRNFSDYCNYLIENANQASLKLYSDADLYCKIFSDVLDTNKPALVGDLKIEKVDDDTIVVTDVESGDEAQVTVTDDDEFVVNDVQKELDEEEKEFSVTMTEDELNGFAQYLYSDLETEDDIEDNEQYEPNYVVGIDPVNHIIVDAPVYDEEDAEVLAQRLTEDGVEEVEIFETPEEARDHAVNLLGEAGVTDIEQVAEPEEHNFSDVTIYATRYFSDCTEFMFKLFSEAEEEITDTQDVIEDAIEKGEQAETENEVITPIDEETAVVHDKENDEYTKVTLDGEDINTEKISEEEADELTQDIEPEDDEEEDKDVEENGADEEEEEDEKKFSVINKFFSDDVDPETGDPINPEMTEAPEEPAQEEEDEDKPSVEVVEDKALAAVQSIQEAANEAVIAITEAKEAPAEQPEEEEDLKEAQFSELTDFLNGEF